MYGELSLSLTTVGIQATYKGEALTVENLNAVFKVHYYTDKLLFIYNCLYKGILSVQVRRILSVSEKIINQKLIKNVEAKGTLGIDDQGRVLHVMESKEARRIRLFCWQIYTMPRRTYAITL